MPNETDPPELWYPQQINPSNPGGRANHYQSVIGKLKPGMTIQRAPAEFSRIMAEEGRNKTPNFHTFDPKFHTILALPYQGEVIGNVKTAMLVMLGAVVFVLLIACVNVGNLLLARAETRHHEIAVRKGHEYRIVVSDLIRQRAIWFGGADRSEASMGQCYQWLAQKK